VIAMARMEQNNIRIGSVVPDNPVFLAPLAGVSDLPFRLFAKQAGCGLVYTEMISAQGLIRANRNSYRLLDIVPEEKPVAVQLFGSDRFVMADAAQIAAANGADIIDINMGCPVTKVVKNGEGCAMMRNLKLAAAVIRAVAEATPLPVTVKMRKGWDEKESNAVELAVLAEAAGAKAVAVHGRTREQFYSGEADWEVIRAVKERISVPVIGNGDIFAPPDAARMFAETGCDAVMIGRGALGNPWLFQRTLHYLTTGELLPEPSGAEKIALALRHLMMLTEYKGEKSGVREMRKHASWYIKGLRAAATVRTRLNRADTITEMKNILLAYRAELTGPAGGV
jgi:tRNA-dihydrouridine synthase B